MQRMHSLRVQVRCQTRECGVQTDLQAKDCGVQTGLPTEEHGTQVEQIATTRTAVPKKVDKLVRLTSVTFFCRVTFMSVKMV